jgi:hypothetical protein
MRAKVRTVRACRNNGYRHKCSHELSEEEFSCGAKRANRASDAVRAIGGLQEQEGPPALPAACPEPGSSAENTVQHFFEGCIRLNANDLFEGLFATLEQKYLGNGVYAILDGDVLMIVGV